MTCFESSMYPDSGAMLAVSAFNIVSSVIVEYWSKHSTVTVTIPSVIVAFILHMLHSPVVVGRSQIALDA